ncbi:target of myb protein [Anaeramoeba flamelloides]|uniref:Target of myb protein n=1 Tax=Anaeramoeba flamelloides TaxID=1746091 RepID=A0AAV7ZAZ7_9EUKA|nr:target of myb protein [Anaeramoeba flamelloides]
MNLSFFQTSKYSFDIEKATSETLLTTNWKLNYKLVFCILQSEQEEEPYLKSIKKRLTKRNPKIRLLALHLLDLSVRYCTRLARYIMKEDYMKVLIKIIKRKRTNPTEDCDYALFLLHKWARGFKKNLFFQQQYAKLLQEGFEFPSKSQFDPLPRLPEKYKPILKKIRLQKKKLKKEKKKSMLYGGNSKQSTQSTQSKKPKQSKQTNNQENDSKNKNDFSIENFINSSEEISNLLIEILINYQKEQNIQADEIATKLVKNCNNIQIQFVPLIQNTKIKQQQMNKILFINDEINRALNLYDQVLKFGTVQKKSRDFHEKLMLQREKKRLEKENNKKEKENILEKQNNQQTDNKTKEEKINKNDSSQINTEKDNKKEEKQKTNENEKEKKNEKENEKDNKKDENKNENDNEKNENENENNENKNKAENINEKKNKKENETENNKEKTKSVEELLQDVDIDLNDNDLNKTNNEITSQSTLEDILSMEEINTATNNENLTKTENQDQKAEIMTDKELDSLLLSLGINDEQDPQKKENSTSNLSTENQDIDLDIDLLISGNDDEKD